MVIKNNTNIYGRFKVIRTPNMVEVAYPWREISIFIFSFSMGLMLLWMYSEHESVADISAANYVFHILLIVLAVIALYVGLAKLVNRTTVRIKGDEVRVSFGPLPWRPALTYDKVEITGIHATAILSTAYKRGYPMSSTGDGNAKLSHDGYALLLISRGDQRLKLCTTLGEPHGFEATARVLRQAVGLPEPGDGV